MSYENPQPICDVAGDYTVFLPLTAEQAAAGVVQVAASKEHPAYLFTTLDGMLKYLQRNNIDCKYYVRIPLLYNHHVRCTQFYFYRDGEHMYDKTYYSVLQTTPFGFTFTFAYSVQTNQPELCTTEGKDFSNQIMLKSISKIGGNIVSAPANVTATYLYFRFLHETRRHISLVNQCAEKFQPYMDEKLYNILMSNVPMHDIDKTYNINIIGNYAPYNAAFYTDLGVKVTPECKVLRDGIAWEEHYQFSGHHPEHWAAVVSDDQPVDASKMPLYYVAEMVADWMAVGLIMNNTATEWFNKANGKKWTFTIEQTQLIKSLLAHESDIIKDVIVPEGYADPEPLAERLTVAVKDKQTFVRPEGVLFYGNHSGLSQAIPGEGGRLFYLTSNLSLAAFYAVTKKDILQGANVPDRFHTKFNAGKCVVFIDPAAKQIRVSGLVIRHDSKKLADAIEAGEVKEFGSTKGMVYTANFGDLDDDKLQRASGLYGSNVYTYAGLSVPIHEFMSVEVEWQLSRGVAEIENLACDYRACPGVENLSHVKEELLNIEGSLEAIGENTKLPNFGTPEYAAKRKKVTDHLLKHMKMLDPAGDNFKRYNDMLSKMSDKAFHRFMVYVKEGTDQIHIQMPNMKSRLDMESILKTADALGVNFFHRLWLEDDITGKTFLTNEPYPIFKVPVRRQQQFLEEKLSVPDNDTTIDGLSGQVTGPDQASAISNPEIRVLHTRGLERTLLELVKVRGGDIHAYGDFRRQLEENGVGELEKLDGMSTARSAVVAGILLECMHIGNNFTG